MDNWLNEWTLVYIEDGYIYSPFKAPWESEPFLYHNEFKYYIPFNFIRGNLWNN